MCGWRDELIGELLEEYKYQSVRVLGDVLAEILDARIPVILGEVIVVPLPTIRRHVRERGLDHTLTMGRKLAERRGWKCESLIARARNTVQVGASAAERKRQAAQAYMLAEGVKLQSMATYLLVDDVWTTGASMMAAEEILREAGAEKVMMAVLAVSRSKEKTPERPALEEIKTR